MEETFETYLKNLNLAQNTIKSYLFTIRQYTQRQKILSPKGLRECNLTE